MFKKIKKDEKMFFQCEECEFLYKKKEWAEKCETYCKKYHGCSIEITAQAIGGNKKWLKTPYARWM